LFSTPRKSSIEIFSSVTTFSINYIQIKMTDIIVCVNKKCVDYSKRIGLNKVHWFTICAKFDYFGVSKLLNICGSINPWPL
jgi:hypothetical protein